MSKKSKKDIVKVGELLKLTKLELIEIIIQLYRRKL